jgi:hypothetical protein
MYARGKALKQCLSIDIFSCLNFVAENDVPLKGVGLIWREHSMSG